MDYGEVISRAWRITWKNKGLWLLGILAGCSGGNGNPSQSLSWQVSRGEFPMFNRYQLGVPEETWILIAVGVFCLVLIVAIAFFVLSLLGQAGLISGVSQADENGSVTLGSAWRGGVPHFWKLLGLSLLLLLVALLVAFALGIFAVITLGIGFLCLIPLLCVLAPFGLLVVAYINLVQNGIVVDGLGVFDAVARAWEMLKRDFWPVVVMALILFGIALLVGVVLAVPILLALVPLMAIAFSNQGTAANWIPLVGCLVVFLPLLIVIAGVIKTFTSGVWTLTYRRLSGKMGLPDVVPTPA
jgi:hypothetical protein